jgi:hypothetical protein
MTDYSNVFPKFPTEAQRTIIVEYDGTGKCLPGWEETMMYIFGTLNPDYDIMYRVARGDEQWQALLDWERDCDGAIAMHEARKAKEAAEAAALGFKAAHAG